MRLYLFQSGTIRTKKHLLVEGPASDAEFVVPIPFFLIRHPQGNVLFDTGQPLSAVNAPNTGNYIPVMTEADYVSNQLARIEMKTADITHIVLSHLHADHAGGLAAFKDAECYLQERELTRGADPDFTNAHPLHWHLLRGEQQGTHDLFGDGRIRIFPTPGHTQGHQSLLVNLENWGPTLLTADSVYTDEILQKGVLPGVYCQREDTIRTIDKIRRLQRDGVKIITGHDPIAWSHLELAPLFYT